MKTAKLFKIAIILVAIVATFPTKAAEKLNLNRLNTWLPPITKNASPTNQYLNIEIPNRVRFGSMGVEELHNLAVSGDLNAQYYIGQKYQTGTQGFAQDKKLTLYWYELSANGSHPHAQFEVAKIYLNTNQMQIGIEWLQKSIEAGNVDAKILYAMLFERGIGVAKDMNSAIYWYEFAANQFDPEAFEPDLTAFHQLIKIYFHGIDTPIDYARVNKYASFLAAMPSDAEGHLYLGKLYENGLGVTKNEQLALNHYLTSIKNNDDKNNERGGNEALYLAGKMYVDGRGADRNTLFAQIYFHLDISSQRSADALAQITLQNKGKLQPLSDLQLINSIKPKP